ncbi:isocitrate/isopropylmalate family dehydrogenase [Amycolatopsis sp. NPDC051903]|uniref:isocitrate/isopropylmalate family dehydrogenase n=1 Tax=Amycolatopsis sp. NPDC051903 TaxID=3363936 RepID=UPI0037B45CFD
MVEPVRGSAPDLAGRGVADPIGAIWTAALMLGHLGHAKAAAGIEQAIADVLAETPLPRPTWAGRRRSPTPSSTSPA